MQTWEVESYLDPMLSLGLALALGKKLGNLSNMGADRM
jgi:hypothetical protein